MENLEKELREELWNNIKRSYNSKHYTNAILDSIQFLGDIIRDKSGLSSDGNNLIGRAFGGANPKIKLNKLKTESEKNIQQGIESILRGLYTAYRNPRSHTSIEDTQSEANEVIIFINHLLKIIDKSKGRFSTDIFLKRVFDDDFFQNVKYSELLVKEIPKNKLFDVAIEIYKSKEKGNIHNLKIVWNSISEKLTNEDKLEIIDLLSEELRYTNSNRIIVRCISLFKKDWSKIDEDSKLRAENKIIQLISDSEKYKNGETSNAGVYASWLSDIVDEMSLKYDLAYKLFDSIESGEENKQRFVFNFFGSKLLKLSEELIFDSYFDIIKSELKKGNPLVYHFVTKGQFSEFKESKFKKEIKNFKERNIDDDLPF